MASVRFLVLVVGVMLFGQCCTAELPEEEECASTGRRCVNDCSHMKNGNYQSCKGCHYFVQCSNGHIYEMPCPTGLEWDDVAKQCVTKSDTCKGCVQAPDYVGSKPGMCPLPKGPGVCAYLCSSDNDCKGNYKCCFNGCGFNCMPPTTPSESNEVTWETINDDMQLEESLEEIRLNHIPRRRRCKSTGYRCVSDCTGKKDGDYQSCHGCDVYVSCVAGLRYDDRPCAPGGLVWDDRKKRCEYNSSTCFGCICPIKPPCHGTGPNCIESCRGLPSGNYQSCKGCHIFVNCNNGRMVDGLPCGPKGTVWDDNKKCCSWYTNTCHPHCRHCGK